MYHRMIVPVPEGADLDSIAPARPLARHFGGTLTLLHVHHRREAPSSLEGLSQYRFEGVVESWTARDHEAEAHEVEWLHDMATRLAAEEEGLTVTSRVVHAPLSRALRADGESALAVVPVDGVMDRGLDPTTLEIVRAGRVPVLVLPGGMTLRLQPRILVTLDGSRFSEEVLPPALELARATGGRLSLLAVVTGHNGLIDRLRPADRSAQRAERFLRKVRSRIPDELGPVDVRVVEMDDAAAGIVREAERQPVDLIAMATHGRGGLSRLMLGSVAGSVVRAGAPMLLHRPVGAMAQWPTVTSPASGELGAARAQA